MSANCDVCLTCCKFLSLAHDCGFCNLHLTHLDVTKHDGVLGLDVAAEVVRLQLLLLTAK